MSSVVLLPASFAILLAGALLFTNGIEWFGSKLELEQGAVGSLFAAVATAASGVADPGRRDRRGSEDVAIGAILGRPCSSRPSR